MIDESREAPRSDMSLPDTVRGSSWSLSERAILRWLLSGGAVVAVASLLWSARSALLPFLIGLVAAYLLLPIVNRLHQYMPRVLAILIVYGVGFTLVSGVLAMFVPLLIEQTWLLLNRIPTPDQAQQWVNRVIEQYGDRLPTAIEQPIEASVRQAVLTLQSTLTASTAEAGRWMFSQSRSLLSIMTFLLGLLIVPFWVFYVLNDAHVARAWIDRLLPSPTRADVWNVWGIIDRTLSGYVRGQLLLALTVSGMVGLGLGLLRLLGFPLGDVIVPLAIIAGGTDLVPIIGPILGALPALVIGMLISPQTALAMLVLYLIVQQVENYVLVPRIIGESVDIHPAILLILLIAAGSVFGIVGVLLTAPCAAIGRDVFLYAYRRLGGASPAGASRA